MISLEIAASKAKDFLSKQGILFVTLAEIKLTEGRWIVVYEGRLFREREKYIIELLKDTGEIINFLRE